MANKFNAVDVKLEERTLGQLIAKQARDLGDKVFVQTTDGETLTYRDLHLRSNQLAHGLAELGIEHQEPVLVMMPDTTDFLLIWAALGKRGAIQVPINLAYQKSILKRICNDSMAKSIFIDIHFLDRLEEICDELESLEKLILYSEDKGTNLEESVPQKLAERCQTVRFSTLLSESTEEVGEGPRFNDLLAIMYTSGTTGASKGVCITQSHAFCYADSAAEIFHLCSSDRFYSSGLPLFHVGCQWAVCYATLIYGGAVVLRQGYSNDNFWPDVKNHDCTVVFLLGAIANFLWQQPRSPDDHETTLTKVGMFPVIPEHEAFCERYGVEIAAAYASTECPTPIIHHFGDPFPNNQCVGYPTGKYEVTILDEDDRECPTGQMGEICVRPKGPWEILSGYWRQPEYTAKAFRNLWYHTGDAGYQDKEGRFYFVDRLTDSMRRRGENISSMEVEDEINQHPDVLECAVFPVWDEHTEQEVMAVITPKPGSTIDPKELIVFLNARMAYFMIPRYLDFQDDIPKTPTGKIQKYKLREKGVTPTSWDRVQAGVKLSR